MTRLSDSAVLASAILRRWSALKQPGAALVCDARDEERLEALDAVLAEMHRNDADRDRFAACRYLLQHLSWTPDSVS